VRIGLLSYEYPPETGFGGIGTYTWTQARALVLAGHEVHVLAGATAPGPIRRSREGGVTVWRGAGTALARGLGSVLGRLGWWWSRNRFENGLRMRRLLRAVDAGQELDIVEVPDCGGEGLFLESRNARRKVVRFHSPAALIMPFYATRAGDRRLCARLERRANRGAAAATACSGFLAREAADRLGFAAPIATIRNGIELAPDASAPDFDLRAGIGAPADRRVVLFAGRLEPRKGSALLGELVPELLGRRQVEFVVLGEDLFGLGEALRERCRAIDRPGTLHLLGRRPLLEVRSAMRQADVVLLPSRWESAPYTVLEAMALGRPLVASLVGGLPEMAVDGREALLVQDGDGPAHLRAVEGLLDNVELSRNLGIAARARVERDFSAARMAESSLAVYRRVLALP
jgi:glycogen(starch) synthase